MSQQSLTFLSQSANNIRKPPKPIGGTAKFEAGSAGQLILKQRTQSSLQKRADDDKENERYAEASRPLRLAEFHYATSRQLGQERVRLGVLDIPPKPVGSVPGYSGYVPRKEAANIIGETYKTANLHAAELFAAEQEVKRAKFANILGPDKDLKTPDTSQ